MSKICTCKSNNKNNLYAVPYDFKHGVTGHKILCKKCDGFVRYTLVKNLKPQGIEVRKNGE